MRTDPALDNAIPECTDAEYTALKTSIVTHGYLPGSEIVVSEGDDVLLDGRSRLRACNELGIDAPVARVKVPPDQRWDYVVVVNLRRRHLTIEQRREIIREYLRRHPEQSDRAAAAATGVTAPTIGAARREIGERSPFPAAGGRGVRILRSDDDEGPTDALEDVADHRNQVWFETTFGYPADSERERTRASLPYPQPSERKIWVSHRNYLVTPAPSNDAEMVALLNEHAQRLKRLTIERPWLTMHRHATAGV